MLFCIELMVHVFLLLICYIIIQRWRSSTWTPFGIEKIGFYRATLYTTRSLLSCGVRLFLCLSVTLVYCVETAELTVKIFYGPIILVFRQGPDCEIPTGSSPIPHRDAK